MCEMAWMFLMLCSMLALDEASAQRFQLRPPQVPNRPRLLRGLTMPNFGARPETKPTRVPLPPPGVPHQGPIKRGGPPYLVIQSMNANKNSQRKNRLVLSLPKDKIQILSAEAMPERGSSSKLLPTTLTLSLRNPADSEESDKDSRYGTTRGYASQIPSPPRQSLKFHYGFMPVTQSGSKEESKKKSRWSKGEVSYDLDDMIGSPGGHVTIVKAHGMPQMPKYLSGRKLKGGSSLKGMKAIIIEPKEIEAKRIRVVETDSESVPSKKGRYIKALEPQITMAMKANYHPVSYKKATLSKGSSKGEDWAASNVHFVNAEPPADVVPRQQQQEEDMPPMSELHCGGTNDLGWCDLGENYPSTEVSEIMEMCEELVSRMYVEVPESAGSMEDVASYSLSRNISESVVRPFWPWSKDASSAHYTRPLCDAQDFVIKPSFAQDIKGKWHVIIQTKAYPQRVSLQVCSKPGEPCRANRLCSSNPSQCVQRYTHHQLISFDPESSETCPYVRLYKFPTSCVCKTED